jgi:hypothetical protein
MLRKQRNDPRGKIFRKGGCGSWKSELPDDIVDVFRHHEPYPTLFQALGYTLDPHDPLIDAPAKPRASANPFLNNNELDNGIEVPMLIIKLYLMLDPALKSRWRGSETEIGEGSFFAWLNAPADADAHRHDDSPIITNLANHIYGERSDLQTAFPDLFGEDRHRFVHWFTTHAQTEYALDEAFIEPMRSDMETVSLAPNKRSHRIRSLLSSLYRKLSSSVSTTTKSK